MSVLPILFVNTSYLELSYAYNNKKKPKETIGSGKESIILYSDNFNSIFEDFAKYDGLHDSFFLFHTHCIQTRETYRSDISVPTLLIKTQI